MCPERKHSCDSGCYTTEVLSLLPLEGAYDVFKMLLVSQTSHATHEMSCHNGRCLMFKGNASWRQAPPILG